MSSQVLILQLALLGVVLESDVGTRKIGWFRVARPIIVVAAIAPTYLTSLPTTGHDLLLQLIGVLAGVVLGAIVVSPLFTSDGVVDDFRSHWAVVRRAPGRPAYVTRAGAGYASVWIAVCVLRLFFAYGSTHLFAHGLGEFLHDNQLTGEGLTNALVFFSIAMDLTRSAGLVVRRRRLAAEHGPLPHPDHADLADRGHAAAHAAQSAAEVGATVLGAAASAAVEHREERLERRGRRRRRLL